MHTVKWIAQQLGLTPGTLRAWEQRYAIVHPARSEGGYRLYSDDDFLTLQTMNDLVRSGMQPAQAAEQVREGRVTPTRNASPGIGVPAGLPDPRALVAISRAYDTRALEETLDTAFAAAGFEHVVDVWLMEAMVELGHAWANGNLDVSQEHFISAGVIRRLSAAFDAAGHARGGRHVVTGLAPGATHEIATLAFSTMLRRLGVRVTYLGPDLPVASWVQAVRTTRPDAVVVGAPRLDDAGAAADVVSALREAAPTLAVHVGGFGAPPAAALQGDSLAQSADWLADSLVTAS